MNEKVKHIMEKVGLHNPLNKEVTDKELDFFATAIVEACMDAVKQTDIRHAYTTYDKDLIDTTINKSIKSIKKTFGMSHV
jgi:hypothetical protein